MGGGRIVGEACHFIDLLPKLKNKHIIITHVSRRISIRRARGMLKKRIGEERMANIMFLMDFEGSTEAGAVEDAGPPALESPE